MGARLDTTIWEIPRTADPAPVDGYQQPSALLTRGR